MHLSLPDLSSRLEADEWMDDPGVGRAAVARALDDLRRINSLLGGYAATNSVLDPLLRRSDRLRILDVGCGGGDYLVHVARRGQAFNCATEVVGLDANPTIVGEARAHLDRRLSPSLRSRVHVEIGDALNPPFPADAFDLTHAALFLHHFHGEKASHLLRMMDRLSRHGLVVNDLHRHPLAHAGIWTLTRLLGMSALVQHDGPISVRRGFHQTELRTLATTANLPTPSIHWHWAFRWVLTTVGSRNS